MYKYFLNPSFLNPDSKYFRKAKIYFWCIFVLLAFLIPYTCYFTYYYPVDVVKNLTNYIGISLFAFTLVLLRFSTNFNIPVMYAALLSYAPISISVYHSGGIYSADLAWVFVCMISQGLIVGYWWGIVSAIFVSSYLTFLFLKEKGMPETNNMFKEHVLTHGSTHYYFTWLFVSLLIIALIGTFAKVLDNTNLKLKQMSEQKINDLEIRVKQKTDEISQLRSSLARDFHDEMGNKLASINILSQSVALSIKPDDSNQEALKLLETISQRSKELFDGTKDFIWSIDFKSDYLFELYVYLREFGERFFNELEINFLSDSNLDAQSLAMLKSTQGRQLILVCKELMTNAAKHSKCAEVNFRIEQKDTKAKIVFEDNGLGFDYEKVSKRGLNNITSRLEKLNASFEIDSSSKGTKISIILHLEKTV